MMIGSATLLDTLSLLPALSRQDRGSFAVSDKMFIFIFTTGLTDARVLSV